MTTDPTNPGDHMTHALLALVLANITVGGAQVGWSLCACMFFAMLGVDTLRLARRNRP